MDLSFKSALNKIGANGISRVANAARPPQNYLFATVLPEVQSYTYQAKAGSMTVRSGMAGYVGMDSVYPETGMVELSAFTHETVKLANKVTMPEAAIRELQYAIQNQGFDEQGTTDYLMTQVLNFTSKSIVQPHLDTAEWLRGQALSKGAIAWTFNGRKLAVSYNFKASNKLTKRTGNDAYGGTTSKFWDDIAEIYRLLEFNVRAVFVNSTTAVKIIYNAANSLEVSGGANPFVNGGTLTLTRRMGGSSTSTALERNPQSTVTLIVVNGEGEVNDPASPTATKKLKFLEDGYMVAIGSANTNGWRVGAGSTATTEFELGFTHIGPTTEGGNQPGRWARVYTPEQYPWQVVGEGVTNMIPVIENPDKIVVASTDV